MALGFLDHMRVVPDHRIPGMVTYPLDEILLATLAGIVCGADDWDGIEEIATGALDWLRAPPFAEGVPTAQTFRKVFRLLDAPALQRGFAAWAASMRGAAREVIAVDGKTLRGSKMSSDGTGALHLVSAYATEAGLVLAQRAVEGKSNEITAIPELLDMLNLKGAIVTIDPMERRRRSPGASSTRAPITCSPSKAIRRACTRTPRFSSPTPSAPRPARARPRPSTSRRARSKSVCAAPPTQLARRPPARVEGPAILRRRHRPAHRQKEQAPKASRRGSMSARSNLTRKSSSPACAAIGASKTISTGQWT